MHGVYKASLKDARAAINKKVRNGRTCLLSLKNQDSDYALEIRSMLSLHEQVAAIYNNAPDDLNSNQPSEFTENILT